MYAILTDSSGDLPLDFLREKGIYFASVPLSIQVGDENFLDDEALSIPHMLQAMKSVPGAASTACPSPDAFRREMEKAERVFVVTISSRLSGAYGTAYMAAKQTGSSSVARTRRATGFPRWKSKKQAARNSIGGKM